MANELSVENPIFTDKETASAKLVADHVKAPPIRVTRSREQISSNTPPIEVDGVDLVHEVATYKRVAYAALVLGILGSILGIIALVNIG